MKINLAIGKPTRSATSQQKLLKSSSDTPMGVSPRLRSSSSPSAALSETGFEARLQYSLTGTTAANTMTGGSLNDTLAGRDGNDVITGGQVTTCSAVGLAMTFSTAVAGKILSALIQYLGMVFKTPVAVATESIYST